MLADLLPTWLEESVARDLITIAAALGALAVIWNYAISPVIRGIRHLSATVDEIQRTVSDVIRHEGRIDAIEAEMKAIHRALSPTNGDRRSISDRLDSVKTQTAENSRRIDLILSTVLPKEDAND